MVEIPNHAHAYYCLIEGLKLKPKEQLSDIERYFLKRASMTEEEFKKEHKIWMKGYPHLFNKELE